MSSQNAATPPAPAAESEVALATAEMNNVSISSQPEGSVACPATPHIIERTVTTTDRIYYSPAVGVPAPPTATVPAAEVAPSPSATATEQSQATPGQPASAVLTPTAGTLPVTPSSRGKYTKATARNMTAGEKETIRAFLRAGNWPDEAQMVAWETAFGLPRYQIATPFGPILKAQFLANQANAEPEQPGVAPAAAAAPAE